MVATYKLPVSFMLTRSCLGRSFFARIAGHRARMTLPRADWVAYDVKGTDGEMKVSHEFRVLAPRWFTSQNRRTRITEMDGAGGAG